MTGEIDRDFYCSVYDMYADGDCDVAFNGLFECISTCKNYHRKWPTPEQFAEEYGHEYPDDGAVYFLRTRGVKFIDGSEWGVCRYITSKRDADKFVICACTPWGNPPDDWRP